MEFIFKAKDQTGQLKEGKVEAINKESAIQLLQSRGFIPVSVGQEERVSNILKNFQKYWEGINQKELSIFFRQLSVLVDARVPIVSALKTIKDQAGNSFLKMVVEEMSQDIEDGMSFSEALAKHPTVFSPLVVSLIRAGEASGNLQKSTEFVANSLERSYQLASKIKGALFYPAFVIVVAAIIGFVVISFILPKLTAVIKEMEAEVPWYTKAMMSLGDFMSAYWWAVLIAIIGAIVGLIYYLKTEDGRKELDRIQLKIPVLNKLFIAVYVSRFLDNFSILLSGGIPVVRALNIVNDVIGNSVYQKIILKAADEVKTGGNISDVFAKSPDIPPVVTKMVKIGEESGKLAEILKKTSSFYENEIETLTRTLSSMIEPILMVLLGIGVGIMVFSVLLPIYNIAGQIK